MSIATISPTMSSLQALSDAVSKKQPDLLKDLLERKIIAAQLPLYLEDINPDGYTPVICAVKREDLESTDLLAKAGCRMFVPRTGQSALHVALSKMTIDQRMLDLLLSHGADPYIPDKSGRTAMEVVLRLRASKEGLYKEADSLGLVLRKFIKAKNAYTGRLSLLVKPSGAKSWIKSKPVWKERCCALVPRCDQQGVVVATQLLVFSCDLSRLKDTLTISEAQARNIAPPDADRTRPDTTLGLELPKHQKTKPEDCYTAGCATSGWVVFIGMPSTAGQGPELADFVTMVAKPAAVLFAPAPVSSPVAKTTSQSLLTIPTLPEPLLQTSGPHLMTASSGNFWAKPPATTSDPGSSIHGGIGFISASRDQTSTNGFQRAAAATGGTAALLSADSAKNSVPSLPQKPTSASAAPAGKPSPGSGVASAQTLYPAVHGAATATANGVAASSAEAAAQSPPQSPFSRYTPSHSRTPSDTATSIQPILATETQSAPSTLPSAPPWPALPHVPSVDSFAAVVSEPRDSGVASHMLTSLGPRPSSHTIPGSSSTLLDSSNLPDSHAIHGSSPSLDSNALSGSATASLPVGAASMQGLASLQEGYRHLVSALTGSSPSLAVPQSNAEPRAENPVPLAPPVMVTETIDFHLPAHRLCLQHDWQQLAAQCKALNVDLTLVNQGSVTLHGAKDDVSQATGLLRTACDEAEQSCIMQSLPLEAHKAAIFRHHDLKSSGQQMIEAITKQHRVLCHLSEEAIQLSAFHGVDVQVVKGNLTKQTATAIVNPTNNQLALSGGVSKHIAKAAGKEALQRSCKDLLAARPAGQRSVPNGTAVTTCCSDYGLQLPCKYIMHAVGPHFNGADEQADIPVLASAVKAVLAQAAQHSVHSLAIPLIGAGAAGWPHKLAARIHVEQVLEFVATASTLQEVHFVDLDDNSFEALEEAVACHKQDVPCSLSFQGRQEDCEAAMQQMDSQIEGCLVHKSVKLCTFLSPQQRLALMQDQKLELVQPELAGDKLSITGCKGLVSQAANYIYQLNMEAMEDELNKKRDLPADWVPMTSNTELFEVPLDDPAVAGIVKAVQNAGAEVVKVHRIQNQLLWGMYASSLEAMRQRWRQHEPNLQLVNGGGATLWHGTSRADPYGIYATEHGFQHNHARADGPALWGHGTYYATRPKLAMDYAHTVSWSDEGIVTGSTAFAALDSLKQILAVEVLTGKAKELAQDSKLRMPPLLEDDSVGRRLGVANLRYDSVSGVHPQNSTPIFITYNSGHAYPKYLVTYR